MPPWLVDQACSPMHALLRCVLTLSAGLPLTAADYITIVSSLPRTGSANAQTTTIVKGIRLALQQANHQVAGMTIRYHDWDDASPERGAWDPSVEAANARKAIADPTVVAYIGTYNSGAAKIAMPILNQANLVMVSPGNTYTGLTKPGLGEKTEPDCYRPSGKVTYFRVVPADDVQGSVGAAWAAEMGVKKAFVLHDRELYGKGLADIFQTAAPQKGIQIVGVEGIDGKAANYRSLVTKIRASGADLVYFGGTTQTNAGQLAKDLLAGGLAKVRYMVPDGCFEKAFIEAAGAAALEGRTYITFGGVPPERLTGKGAEFVAEYRKAFNAEPEAYAAYGYEAASVVLDAIARAKTNDRAAITAAVAQTRDFHGVLGTWSFDRNGDTTLKLASGNTVKNGQFEFVKVLGE